MHIREVKIKTSNFDVKVDQKIYLLLRNYLFYNTTRVHY